MNPPNPSLASNPITNIARPSWQRRSIGAIKFVGCAVAGILGVIALLSIVGRAVDPPLSDQAQLALKWPQPNRQIEGNAYFWTHGLHARDGVDHQRAGERVARQLGDVHIANPHVTDIERHGLYAQVQVDTGVTRRTIHEKLS